MLQTRFSELTDFLTSCQPLWSDEVIDQYPRCLELYPEAWISEITQLEPDQLFDLEHSRELASIRNRELRSYYEQHARLAKLPRVDIQPSERLGHTAFFRVGEKKRHEISVVSELVADICRKQQIDCVIDFGGGIGYLAQSLAHHYQLPTISIDRESSLQDTGRKRHAIRKTDHSSELQYVEMDCAAIGELPGEGKRLLLGLHTCGTLANAQIQAAVRENCPALLNFSCCYHKLSDEDYYLSRYGSQRGVRLTPKALTLASRAPRYTRKTYDFSKRVKYYRYLIHLFLYHELGIREFVSFGNSTKQLYRGDFTSYALEQLGRIGQATDKDMARALEAFAQNAVWQDRVMQMVAANIIRGAATRSLELLLLCDRAIYASEQGYEATLAEYFDDILSPRNIGLLAIKN